MKEVITSVMGSATKIVFIMIACALVAFTAMGKIESKEFMVLSMMVFTSYYRANRTDANNEKKENSDARDRKSLDFEKNEDGE